ncbi:Fic family protein, partial [Patescibacteria group bacterium]|nr:Fic family protein [Patescibacteria group bacterium]
MNQLNHRQTKILSVFSQDKPLSPKQLSNLLDKEITTITLSRDLSLLLSKNYLLRIGHGPKTTYKLTNKGLLFRPIDIDKYFSIPIDSRNILPNFNFSIFSTLKNSDIFNKDETKQLLKLQKKYLQNFKKLSPTIIQKEIERITIELSWKSSLIEGNTYSLLDTELLLKKGIEAKGKQKSETIMLLNHKDAIDLIFNQKKYFKKTDLPTIQEIHRIITYKLNVSKNLRKTLVGITGTKYKPLDNQYQIRESMQKMCRLINSTDNIFTKSLLSMILISYIQPFEDGNKRTGRIIGNAILLAHNHFPIPFRSVDEKLYKQATL